MNKNGENGLKFVRKRRFDVFDVKLPSEIKRRQGAFTAKKNTMCKETRTMTAIAIIISALVGIGLLWALTVILGTFVFRKRYHDICGEDGENI